MRISLFVAADEKDVIGLDGALPWHLPDDLKRFKRISDGHVMVVGRLTHDSIVRRLGRALPGRINVVVTRQTELRSQDNVIYVHDLPGALSVAVTLEGFSGRAEVFVIGGSEIYRQALPDVTRIYLTRVHDTFEGDASMPDGWLDGFELIGDEPQDGYSYLTYERA